MEESSSITPSFSDAIGVTPATASIEPSSSLDAFDVDGGPGAESSYSIWSVVSFILIILIVWVLFFNFFDLGKITDWIESFLRFVGYSTGETIKTTTSVGATGVTGSTNVAAGAVTGGINLLEKGLNLTPEEKARAQSQNQAKVTALYPPSLNPMDVQKTEESTV